MVAWTKEARAMPWKPYEIRSFDGLGLTAKYYEYSPDSVIELMFHGYRGNAERDLSGGVQRCFALGRSSFIVDQRGCGSSEGSVISFGINEHRDCLSWLELVRREFPGRKIILTGISMGASTVLMAAGEDLPPNVVGVLADCGFTSAREVIQKVLKDMGLPPKLLYPFVKLGATVFGQFDLEETDAQTALKNCKIPVIFYHGEDDDFVPCAMSEKLYEACPTRKQLVTIPGAGHGLSYAVDPDRYLQTRQAFFSEDCTVDIFDEVDRCGYV
jgi:pimeloyl-ACP methyl ester carboxylesterase